VHLATTLWSSTPGAHTPPSASSDEDPATDPTPGALAGHFEWPFAFTLPGEVPFAGKFAKAPTPHRIPGTFVEKNGGALFVQYDLVCHIRRTRFRTDSKSVPAPRARDAC
jgi:hypothetical protein